jgi:hypothetical protein
VRGGGGVTTSTTSADLGDPKVERDAAHADEDGARRESHKRNHARAHLDQGLEKGGAGSEERGGRKRRLEEEEKGHEEEEEERTKRSEED